MSNQPSIHDRAAALKADLTSRIKVLRGEIAERQRELDSLESLSASLNGKVTATRTKRRAKKGKKSQRKAATKPYRQLLPQICKQPRSTDQVLADLQRRGFQPARTSLSIALGAGVKNGTLVRVGRGQYKSA